MKKGMLILSGVLGLSMIALVLMIMVYIARDEIIGRGDLAQETVQSTEQESSSRASVMLVTLPKEIELPDWADEFKDTITEDLLPVNEYSRPGLSTNEITGIVIHYTANPGSTAMENRDYFEGLKDSHITQASSNFVVGLDGEIVQCVPTWEVAYASNTRNFDTVSIECCHPDETGKFNEATYKSMVQLTAWLCEKFSLTEEDVIRHYDITGKICPKYFVENEDAWKQFKSDVKAVLDNAK